VIHYRYKNPTSSTIKGWQTDDFDLASDRDIFEIIDVKIDNIVYTEYSENYRKLLEQHKMWRRLSA